MAFRFNGVRRWHLDRRSIELEMLKELPLPASYIIFEEEGIVKAFNVRKCFIEFSDKDASTVIQRAINALTPGRTWKERIVLY